MSQSTKASSSSSMKVPSHGFLADPSWAPPKLVTKCLLEARPGYQSKSASEYLDTPEVLRQKVSLLVRLLQGSTHTLLYTGAGISTSSGISDFATRSDASVVNKKKISSVYAAEPSLAHSVLAFLHTLERPLVHYWVQQNHDGLPQKAGFPQHSINEIHGALYDPSNPIVPMSGELRGDLYASMLAWEKKASLCLSLGTTMCGMNADRCFTTVAQKAFESRKSPPASSQRHIGGVIVNLQETLHDGIAALRIWAKIDDVMRLVLLELGVDEATVRQKHSHCPLPPLADPAVPDVFVITDRKDSAKSTRLDLRQGAVVTITDGPHKGKHCRVIKKSPKGHYLLEMPKNDGTGSILRRLGCWLITAAIEGSGSLPVVNASAAVVAGMEAADALKLPAISTSKSSGAGECKGVDKDDRSQVKSKGERAAEEKKPK